MDTSTPDPQTRAELLPRIAAARGRLDQLVGRLSEEQLTRPGPDSWSVKDHLAHIAAWEQSLLALLEGRNRDAAVGVTVDSTTEDGGHDVDAVNTIIFERHRRSSLGDVLDWYRQSHTQVLAAVHRLSDDDLQRPYSHYQPQTQPYEGRPVIGWIKGNTYEHDEEHTGWIEQILASQTS